MPQKLFPRFLESTISSLLGQIRVITVTGPRRSGKTTLARKFASGSRAFHSLENPSTYNEAVADPMAFISKIEYGVIDEIQRAPELIRAIKVSVDSDPRRGRFLLTSSADILAIPTISESLAGRMVILPLLPLAQAEIDGRRVSFLDDLFELDDWPFRQDEYTVDDMEFRVLKGGYPEIFSLPTESARRQFAAKYIESLIKRDIEEIWKERMIQDLARLARACAMQTAQLVSYSEAGKRMKASAKTARRGIGMLEQMHLCMHLFPWFSNDPRRLAKTPKLHFLDTGLASAIRGIGLGDIRGNQAAFGPLLETFALAELLKLASWSEHLPYFHHYRDSGKNKVDFVISSGDHSVIGVDVKASAKARYSDFAGLRKLKQAAGSTFRHGVLLYTGERVVPFGDRLYAAPISVLWS